MTLWNYSSLRRRDKKVYSVAGTQISSTGISVAFLKVTAPCAAITIVLGFLICFVTGKSLMIPLTDDFNFYYTFFAVGSGAGVGLALWYIKVQTYRLYEYLLAYFKPKRVYHNLNTRNIIYSSHNIKLNAIIKSDL